MGFLKRFRFHFVFITLLMIGRSWASPPMVAEDEIALEYQVKAAYVFNFARFVTWPQGAFESPQAPLLITVIGQGPLVAALEKTINGKTIEGRTLLVHETSDASAPSHILVIAKSEARRTESLLKSLQGKPVLTVSEANAISKQSGIIRLWVDEDKVRFAVNVSALEQSGLVASSQMLQYADLGH